ncbi:unnamed protein product, partial [Amoebophrya sp. A120]
PWAIQYASEGLWDDSDTMACVAKIDGLPALKYASHRLRASEWLVRLAVQTNGLAIKFACSEARANYEIALLAVRNNPYARYPTALRWMPRGFRRDREIALQAVRANGEAIKHFGSRIKSDREVGFVAVSHEMENIFCPWTLEYLHKRLRRDEGIVRAA